MVRRTSIERYERIIAQVGIEQAIHLSQTNDLEEIREAFNSNTNTQDSTLLAYQRILRNVLNQIQNPNTANQRVLQMAQDHWNAELESLRETTALLRDTINELRLELIEIRNERIEERERWNVEREEFQRRIQELEQNREVSDESGEDNDFVDEDETDEDGDRYNDFVIRNLDSDRESVDGTLIKHFKREMNFGNDLSTQQVINNANGIAREVFDEMQTFIAQLDYFKITLTLFSANDQAVSKSLSQGFVKAKISDFDFNTLVDSIVDTALLSTSGNVHEGLTFKITGW